MAEKKRPIKESTGGDRPLKGQYHKREDASNQRNDRRIIQPVNDTHKPPRPKDGDA